MSLTAHDAHRRALLKAAALGFASAACRANSDEPDGAVINDISRLNPVTVAREIRPSSVQQLQDEIKRWPGTISVGGGRYSMGGQIAAPDSLHVDMRGLDQLIRYSPSQRIVRVQAGMTWRSLQDHMDPHDQSVKIMQSYSNFTIGGSVSVNCHGRYVGRGALVNSIRAVQVVLPDAQLVEASRDQNADLFRGIVGGYGSLGFITEVELELEQNFPIERVVHRVTLADYPEWFRQEVIENDAVLLHNADLTPPEFDAPIAISWKRTDKALTETRRLIPRHQKYAKEQNIIWLVSELPLGESVRSTLQERMLDEPAVVWRNFEASKDVASLEPRTRIMSTYVLQEYFVPVAGFHAFVRAMGTILKQADTGALNVSIRHSPADAVSLLPWAPQEVFCFVLYYKQRVTESASREAARWTQALIDAALRHGGRYYLPYRLHASQAQFDRAYPESRKLLRLKRELDSRNRLRNALLERYLRLD